MWLKRLSAQPDLPVLYSSLGFSALQMLLTAKKGLRVDIGDFHVYTTVVMGATTVKTNQKAGYRSRGTNGPISVQQKVM